MSLKIINKKDILSFLSQLMKKWEVVGVKKKAVGDYANEAKLHDGIQALQPLKGTPAVKYAFDKLDDSSEACLDYTVTVLPPKKYFMPPHETLLAFKVDKEPSSEPVFDATPRVLFGVHPYDLAAINLLDKVFCQENPDLNYIKRRENTLIVGVEVNKPSPYSFSKSMHSDTVTEGFDLFLTDLGESYAVEVGTKAGEALLAQGNFKDATSQEAEQLQKVKAEKKAKPASRGLKTTPEDLAKKLGEKREHPIWEEKAKKCLSCGSCVTVCPTCYCFDVRDEINVTLSAGERIRSWDGCMLTDFALVGTGENFREHKSERYQHRFFRKGKYILEKYGVLGCVGCGRCASVCLPDIADPVEVFNTLV